MATSKIEKYEKDFQSLNSTKEKFDCLISLYKEFNGQASMTLDIASVWSEEAEDEFDDLGDFILVKLQCLREDLFR